MTFAEARKEMEYLKHLKPDIRNKKSIFVDEEGKVYSTEDLGKPVGKLRVSMVIPDFILRRGIYQHIKDQGLDANAFVQGPNGLEIKIYKIENS